MKNSKFQIKIPFSDEELLRVGQAMGKNGKTDIGDYARNAILGFAKMVIGEAAVRAAAKAADEKIKVTENDL